VTGPPAPERALPVGVRAPALRSPTAFLAHMLGPLEAEGSLRAHEEWWEREGKAVSASLDRAGTPWLRMFDPHGQRVDEILLPPGYWPMLWRGYREGAVWRAFEDGSLQRPYLLGYVTSFYDPGLYCPYTVSLATAIPLEKYGDAAAKSRFLPRCCGATSRRGRARRG
jgi:hypothetical protein